MKPWFRSGLFSILGVLAMSPFSRADDTVTFLDPAVGKEDKVTGAIQAESAAGITIKPGLGAPRDIPANQILDVEYQVPIEVKLDLHSAMTSEKVADTDPVPDNRQKALDAALGKYTALQGQITDDKVKRYVAFKIAKITAREALAKPAQLTTAIDQLAAFKKNNPDSWEITACDNLLADLQMLKGDWNGALATYQDLEKTPNLSRDTVQTCELKIAQVLVKAQKFDEAQKKIESLMGSLKADDPQKTRLQISLDACLAAKGQADQAVKDLQTIISTASDNDLKAMAYNGLGDSYRFAKQWEDARWAYLWVDVIYHQNREEHAKALYYLYKVSKEMKDDTRANQFLDVLEQDKDLAGTEYQRLGAAEKLG